MNKMECVIVITGAGRGLGRAISVSLARPGRILALLSLNKGRLNTVKKMAERKGAKCSIYASDVSDEKAVYQFIKKVIKRYGRIDVLIHNAGWANRPKPIERVTTREMKKYFNVNALSAFYLLKSILPPMKKRGRGMIINIASRAARKAVPGLSGYAASKFAMRSLGETAAKETEGTGIKILTVSPGGINTRMREKLFGNTDAKRQQSPVKVAKIISRIVDEKYNFASGSDIHIKNGKIIRSYRME